MTKNAINSKIPISKKAFSKAKIEIIIAVLKLAKAHIKCITPEIHAVILAKIFVAFS